MNRKPDRILLAAIIIATILLIVQAVAVFGTRTVAPTIVTLGGLSVILGGLIYATVRITKAPKEEKRNYARPGFILLLFLLVFYLISVFEIGVEGEKAIQQEQMKREDPTIYHFLQLTEEVEDATIKVNNGWVYSKIGEDHQTIWFKVPDNLIGKETKINVSYRLPDSKIMMYEGKTMLKSPPDTLTLDALINNQ